VTTGVKIAIGCGVALILGIVVVAAGVFGGAYWLKGKAEEFTGHENRIEELEKKANATPFERPSDNVIREDRFVKFLDVRRRVFGVYEKHRAALEAMGKKKQGDWGDVTTGFSVINEIRLAQAQALADIGMSEDEYHFMVEQVYKTAWATEFAKSTGGKNPSEAVNEAVTRAQEAMREAQKKTAREEERADRADDEATEEQAEDAKEKVDQGIEELGRAGEAARESASQMNVPPANIALFKKYEADIKKYAMGGLEWIGL
jgi:flagellar biosynthesis GTPase FlhF